MPIVEFETEEGTTLLVKVADAGHDGLVTRGLGESAVVEKAQRTFETALRPIRTVSEGVLAELRAIPRHPDAVTVEFGLEFTANSSAVLVGATAAASVRVQMSWKASEAAT
jgi:hypothetical protein